MIVDIAKDKYGEDIVNNNRFRYYPNNYGIVIDQESNMYSKIFHYDLNKDILFDVDIKNRHPYLNSGIRKSSFNNIQQLDGIHRMLSHQEFTSTFPNFYESLNLKTDYIHSRISANTFIQKHEFLSISYFTQIIPSEEILEFIQIPSITTIEIYREEKLITTLENLPFHVEQIEITKNGQYALLVHHEPIDSKDYDRFEWNHCFSVYNLSTKELCYRKKIRNQFSSAMVGENKDIVTVGFEEYPPNQKPITHNYYLRENKNDIVEWVIDHNAKSSKNYKLITDEGVFYTEPNVKNLQLLSFDTDLNSTKLNCK